MISAWPWTLLATLSSNTTHFPAARAYLASVYRSSLSSFSNATLDTLLLSLHFLYRSPLRISDPLPLACATIECQYTRETCSTLLSKNDNLIGVQSCGVFSRRYINHHGFFIPAPMPYSCGAQPAYPTDVFSADHTWVEVLRSNTMAASMWQTSRWIEGGGRGCWFFIAKGSGVFVNVKRGLRLLNRQAAIDVLQLNTTLPKRLKGIDMTHGHMFCIRALEMGYDSIQLWPEECSLASTQAQQGVCSVELVLCHEACSGATPCSSHQGCAREAANGTFVNLTSTPCIPNLPLRTGVHAHLPCKCVGVGFDLLNCAGTNPELQPAVQRVAYRGSTTYHRLPPCDQMPSWTRRPSNARYFAIS